MAPRDGSGRQRREARLCRRRRGGESGGTLKHGVPAGPGCAGGGSGASGAQEYTGVADLRGRQRQQAWLVLLRDPQRPLAHSQRLLAEEGLHIELVQLLLPHLLRLDVQQQLAARRRGLGAGLAAAGKTRNSWEDEAHAVGGVDVGVYRWQAYRESGRLSAFPASAGGEAQEARGAQTSGRGYASIWPERTASARQQHARIHMGRDRPGSEARLRLSSVDAEVAGAAVWRR